MSGISLLEEPINKLEESPSPPVAPAQSGRPFSSAALVDCLAICAVALAARLWFNFGTVHANAYSSADAAEYLRYATGLARVVSGHGGAPMTEILKEFVITGPSLPVFLLLATAVTGQAFDAGNSTIFIGANSFVSALTAGLIYLIAGRLYERRTAITAGVIAAFYPAFIVNTGRLYSETFGTFAETLAVFLLVRSFFPAPGTLAANLLLGATLVVGQLTRSAMILFSAASLPIVALQGLFARGLKQPDWRSACLRTALLLAGMGAILAPWFIFEKAAYNKVSLVVDRVGHYNLFIGTNTATQGFLSYPYPDGSGIEEKSFFKLIGEAAGKSPSRFIKLVMDKPARLLKSPWNDFRCPIGPVTYQMQVALHEAIILLAAMGILLACLVGAAEEASGGPKIESADERNNQPPAAPTNQKIEALPAAKLWGRGMLLFAFALNLPYLAFITVPRYNLTAMPFLIIFAAAGLTTLIYLLKSQPLARSPKAVALLALCLFVFLRDDARELFSFGQQPAFDLLTVQGQDLLARGLISGVFGLALFVSIYFCLSHLSGLRKPARILTVIFALLFLPLLVVPQRANGRAGESILTIAGPQTIIRGAIPVPKATAGERTGEWYLLLDSEDAAALGQNLLLSVNGSTVCGPLIPGISALDDWHYVKALSGNIAYMECAYIYDCMTRPTGISNLDLRQWFYLPLDAAAVKEARRRGCLNITLKHNGSTPAKLFGAALSGDHAYTYIPSRNLYSWEKAFYGVENDRGLTDSRYDEKVTRRRIKWQISNSEKSGENSADLANFDLNLRLLVLKPTAVNSSPPDQAGAVTAGGTTDVELKVPDDQIKSGELTLVRARLSRKSVRSGLQNPPPALYLHWQDRSKKPVKMALPWLKTTAGTLDIALPCNLAELAKNGAGNFAFQVQDGDPDCKIELSARPITGHPVFTDGSLF